jgi:hypothetical protein
VPGADTGIFGTNGNRGEHLCIPDGKSKGRRQDADHGEVRPVERQRCIDDVRPAAERLPEVVSQNDCGSCARGGIHLGQDTAVFGAHAEQRKERRRYTQRKDVCAAIWPVDRVRFLPVQRNVGQGPRLATPVKILGQACARSLDLRAGVRIKELHQPFRLWKRQRCQQDSVDHREHRGIGGNPNRQGENHGHRERRTVGDYAAGVPRIGSDLLQWTQTRFFTHGVLGCGNAAQLSLGGCASCIPRQPAVEVPSGCLVQVVPQLFVQLRFERPAPEQGREPFADAAHSPRNVHVSAFCVASTRLTAPEVRDHCSCSAASLVAPLVVSS